MLHAHLSPGPLPSRMQLSKDGKLKHFLTIEGLPPLLLEEILDRNDISRSVLKDSMSKMAALGQSIGGMFPSDEIVKGSISGYVFEQF